MSESASKLRTAVIERVLEASATTSTERRRAAFDNAGVEEAACVLVDKVTRTAWKVTDEDVAAARAAGLAEDAIFELVVAAALGQSSRQLASALAVLDEVAPKKKP